MDEYVSNSSRSEQDKEPEQEVAAEASGSGPTEESAAESMPLIWMSCYVSSLISVIIFCYNGCVIVLSSHSWTRWNVCDGLEVRSCNESLSFFLYEPESGWKNK